MLHLEEKVKTQTKKHKDAEDDDHAHSTLVSGWSRGGKSTKRDDLGANVRR